MVRCRVLAQQLVVSLQEMAGAGSMPETVKEAERLIQQHDQHIHDALQRPLVQEMTNTAHRELLYNLLYAEDTQQADVWSTFAERLVYR